MKKIQKAKNVKEHRGITLVALVITIIILLILSGIAIATLGGENGLFTKVKQSKEKYSISEAKEKLELSIANLKIEQERKGEQLTKEVLPNINNKEIDIRSVEKFPIEAICNNYKFYINSDFTVEYIGKANETIVTYTTEPEGYTNKDNVKILITISNPKGIKSIQYPNHNNVSANEKTKVVIDYEVTANGIYSFKIIDVEGVETSKDIVINKIDKVTPKDFIISIDKKIDNGFIISANAEDGDKTDSSCKSGIDYYEYYVIDKNENETKYETNEINNLISGDYKVYVIAYDKAGNSKKSNVIYTSVVRKNIWNLGIQNDIFETYQGTPEYKGEEEGLYLSNNSVVSTKSNFNLNDFYTIIIEVKDIKSIGVGFMLAMGNGGGNIGAQYLGICNWPNNYICAMSGAGDPYTLSADNSKLYSTDKWNILAIKYNGTEFSFFIDGKKIGSSSYSILKQSKLYIGGISNSGTLSSDCYWGYGEGYYRNLAIYDGALSDEELENYEF